MNMRAEKNKENRCASAANSVAARRASGGKAALQFEDASPGEHRLVQLQTMANRNPRIEAWTRLQSTIDHSPRQVAQRIQAEHLSVQPAQRQGDVDEKELLQRNFATVQQRQDLEAEELLQAKLARRMIKFGVASIAGLETPAVIQRKIPIKIEGDYKIDPNRIHPKQAPDGGTQDFITDDGVQWVHGRGGRGGHPGLSGGAPVDYAGTLAKRDGMIVGFDNWSGHYETTEDLKEDSGFNSDLFQPWQETIKTGWRWDCEHPQEYVKLPESIPINVENVDAPLLEQVQTPGCGASCKRFWQKIFRTNK